MHRYTSTMQRDVTKHTNLVEWWQVSSSSFCLGIFSVLIVTPQDNAKTFPTLAHIVLDVLPSQASSVPCERLFLGTKQIAVDRCSRLGGTVFEKLVFEELVIMGSAWGPDIYDMAAWSASQEEDVEFFDFEEMLADDAEMVSWEKDSDLLEEEVNEIEE